jgi:hypothetical protein
VSTSTPDVGVRAPAHHLPGYGVLVYALVFVWGFGDAVSTLLAFAFTGRAGLEANPLVRALLTTDPLLVLALKAGVALVVGGALLRYRDVVVDVPLWRPWLLGVTAVGATIVVSNVYVGVSALA